jgi:hypothetical protein
LITDDPVQNPVAKTPARAEELIRFGWPAAVPPIVTPVALDSTIALGQKLNVLPLTVLPVLVPATERPYPE